MTAPLRIGVIGLVHDHIWDNLPDLIKHPEATLSAVADPNEALTQRVAKEFGCSNHYENYDAMLEEESLDAVYIYLSNREGAEAAIYAAEMGLDVMIEKPMASTLEEADEMLASARVNQTRLMINWPLAWWAQLQHALKLAAEGEIGRLWQVKYRAAHAGPKELGCSDYFCNWLFDEEENGAGALMDYCCYGALLARATLGMPTRVDGMKGRFCKEAITVEDNAILTLTYNNAMATAEGSWTQIDKMTAYTTIFYGTEGTLLIEPRDGGKLIKATREDPDGSPVDVPDLAASHRNASDHFIHCLRTGEPFTPLCQDRMCRDTQEILEAGLIAAEEGGPVSLPL